MGVCNCSMFCCTLLYVHSSIAIILMGKRELIALLNLSSWCLLMVERLFLAVPRGCLHFVIVVFPDHTHLLFFTKSHLFLQTFCAVVFVINERLKYNAEKECMKVYYACHICNACSKRNHTSITFKGSINHRG